MCIVQRYVQKAIWLINWPKGKKHYGIVISNDNRNRFCNTLLVVKISHSNFLKHENIKIDLFGKEDFSYINCSEPKPISKSDFVEFIGMVNDDIFHEVISTIYNNVIYGKYDYADSFMKDSDEDEDEEDINFNINDSYEISDMEPIIRLSAKKWSNDECIKVFNYCIWLWINKKFHEASIALGYTSSSGLWSKYNCAKKLLLKRGLISEDKVSALERRAK